MAKARAFFRCHFGNGRFEGALLERDKPVDLVEFGLARGEPFLDGSRRAKPAFLHDIDKVLDLGVDLTVLGEEVAHLGALPVLMTGVASDQGPYHGYSRVGSSTRSHTASVTISSSWCMGMERPVHPAVPMSDLREQE